MAPRHKSHSVHTEETVSLNKRNISLTKLFKKFEKLKKFLWIEGSFVNSKKCLWSKEIDLFTLKNIFLNQQRFL